MRIPAPFPARSATCHVHQTVTVTANANGNMMFIMDPAGGVTGNYNMLSYSDATFADGTLGAATGQGAINPFVAASGTPVAGFQYRVVSASLTITPIMALTTQTGLATFGFVPG